MGTDKNGANPLDRTEIKMSRCIMGIKMTEKIRREEISAKAGGQIKVRN